MADITTFVASTRQTFRMRPVLPLGQELALGSVGVLEGDVFHYRGSLTTLLGVKPGKNLAPTVVDTAKFVSSGLDVTLTVLPKGTPSATFPKVGKGRVRAEVGLANDTSFLLAARGVTTRALAETNVHLLAILGAFRDGTWQPDFVFVYEMGIPASCTAILGRSPVTTVLLEATVKTDPVAVGMAELAHGFGLKSQRPRTESLVGRTGKVAFFNAYRVRPGWFAPELADAPPKKTPTVAQAFEKA